MTVNLVAKLSERPFVGIFFRDKRIEIPDEYEEFICFQNTTENAIEYLK